MRVLVACEFSGVVRDAFLARGHDAISCDLLPTESPGPHIQGDVTPLLREPWDLVIAHPPCTHLCAGHSIKESEMSAERIANRAAAASFFRLCLNSNAPRVAVENPVMRAASKSLVGRGPDGYIDPWMFGNSWKKKTGLWLRGLQMIVPDRIVEPTGHWVDQYALGDKRRKAVRGERIAGATARSKTFPGIARAMAEQWGDGRRPGRGA